MAITWDSNAARYYIKTKQSNETKIDVDAKTGDIEEASFEIYEIGMEEE